MTKVHKLIAGSLLVGSLAGGLGPGAAADAGIRTAGSSSRRRAPAAAALCDTA